MPAIPYTKTATSDGAWDAGANVKRLAANKTTLRACHAWVDATGDADAKGSYKFPHHEVSSDGKVGAANTRACSAIIAALNGGRGGANIPDKDRSGVHAHAAGHLKAAGKDVPELKSLAQIEAELRDSGEMERRWIRGSVELRDDSGGPKLRGYAAVFNEETMIGSPQWGFREQIAPGAFQDAVEGDDVRALFNHDDNQVLGRTKSGTLRLAEDTTGLKYEIDPPDTVLGRDLVNLVSRGDIDGSSFAFRVIEDQWEYPSSPDPTTPAPRPLRTVLKVELFDVSPVTYPAYPQTSVSARAKEKAMEKTQVQSAEERARRDGNGAAGGGDSGDVGGDVGGMEATSAAFMKMTRRLKKVSVATRGLIKALDISHGFNAGDDDGPGLKGPGGAANGTGGPYQASKHLTKAQRKAIRKAMKRGLERGLLLLFRDMPVDTQNGSGTVARELASGVMYQAVRSVRDNITSAKRGVRVMRAILRAQGVDLAKQNLDGEDPAFPKPATGPSRDGDGTMMGSDAGSGGMNKASLADLDLRERELEMERLR